MDKDSELGHSSFKGHPQCGFCRKRFYSDGELYSHMQRDHFTCHICQRAEPDKFVYYADYPKLEEHFRASHRASRASVVHMQIVRELEPWRVRVRRWTVGSPLYHPPPPLLVHDGSRTPSVNA